MKNTSLSTALTLLPTLSNGKSWDTSSLESTGTVSVVPEPGSLALLALGLLPFLRRRRVGQATR